MSHITSTDDLIPGLRVHVLMVGGSVLESRVRAIRMFRDNEYPQDVPNSTSNRGQALIIWEPNDITGGKPNSLSHKTNRGDWYSHLSTLGISHDSARFKSACINGVFHTHEEASEHAKTDEYIKAVTQHAAICLAAENESDRMNSDMDDPFNYNDYDEYVDRLEENDWDNICAEDGPPEAEAEPRDDPESVEHYQRTGGGSNLGDILADALARQAGNNENQGDNRP